MELAFITYLVLQLDTINTIVGISIFIVSMYTVGHYITSSLNYGDMKSWGRVKQDEIVEYKESYIKTSKYLVGILCVLSFVKAVIPSSDNAKYILGAYGVQTAVSAVSENEDVKRIASKSLSAVESMLDKVSEQNKEKK